jgi:organic radical activating enzyme
MNSEEIAEIAASYCKTIVLTGGEPLMWNLEILTKN